MESRKIRIGTSGWHYRHWRGPFYPPDLPASKWLEFYRDRFSTAEINNSFYRLPSLKTFTGWKKTVDKNFVFSVKANRYITHMKKLKDPEDTLKKFLKQADTLGVKLGPILFQLPPRWKRNPERLGAFLKMLPNKYRCAFEFRDPSWFDDRIYDLLEKHGAAFCIYQLAGRISPKKVTADFVYVRLHGPGDNSYQGSYSAGELSGWAAIFSAWRQKGEDIYCYFDNDQNGYAPLNALRLKEMMEKE